MIRLCKDCPERFELTPKQLNFQRFVYGRRNYVLCPKCSQVRIDAKWAKHNALEALSKKKGHNKAFRRKASTAKKVRQIVARM